MPDTGPSGMSTTKLQAVTEALEGGGVDYRVHEHPPADTAMAEAAAERVPPQRVAKTVVLRAGEGWALAVIPASHRLDLHKLRELLGTTGELRLATEDEMAEHFTRFEVGAVPPVGALVAAEVVDARLLDQERVLFAAGDHRHSVDVGVRDLVEVTNSRVADICQD